MVQMCVQKPTNATVRHQIARASCMSNLRVAAAGREGEASGVGGQGVTMVHSDAYEVCCSSTCALYAYDKLMLRFKYGEGTHQSVFELLCSRTMCVIHI